MKICLNVHHFPDTGELPTECIPSERFADLKAALQNVTVHGTILKLSEGQHGPYRASPHVLHEASALLSILISVLTVFEHISPLFIMLVFMCNECGMHGDVSVDQKLLKFLGMLIWPEG
jgi:hypothetical protein